MWRRIGAAWARPKGSHMRNLTSAAVQFDIPGEFKGHRIDPPPQTAEATAEQLLEYHRNMYTVRRMEITADGEYKVSKKMKQSFLGFIFRVC